jgi:hypothetical protein
VPHNDDHRAAIEKIHSQIWERYQALQAYRSQSDESQRPVLTARFTALVEQRSGHPPLGMTKPRSRSRSAPRTFADSQQTAEIARRPARAPKPAFARLRLFEKLRRNDTSARKIGSRSKPRCR